MTQSVQMNTPQMKARHKKVPEHRFREWLHSPSCKCTLLLLATFLVLVVIFLSVCAPRKYDLQVGSISHVTIDATKDVVDEVGTEERRVAADNSVESLHPAATRGNFTADSVNVARPLLAGQFFLFEGKLRHLLILERIETDGPASGRPYSHINGLVDCARKHESAIVIGMFANEVDAARSGIYAAFTSEKFAEFG